MIDTECETGVITGADDTLIAVNVAPVAKPAIGSDRLNAEPVKVNVPDVESAAFISPPLRLPEFGDA